MKKKKWEMERKRDGDIKINIKPMSVINTALNLKQMSFNGFKYNTYAFLEGHVKVAVQ